jgi:hypothetical protein
MKIRNLLGLAAIGSLLYLHRKRGGDFSIASFKDSVQQLWDGIQRAAQRARDDAEQLMRERAREVGNAPKEAGQRGQAFDESFESSTNDGRH